MAQPVVGTNTKADILGAGIQDISVTVASGTDRVLYLVAPIWTDGWGLDSVTFNGVPMLVVADTGEVRPGDRVFIFRLTDPPVGTYTLRMACRSGDLTGLGYGRAVIYNLTGTDPMGPEWSADSNRGTGTAVTVPVDSGTDQVVIDGVATDGAAAQTFTMTADSGRTQIDNAVAGGELCFSSTETSPSASEDMDGTISVSQTWAAAAVSVCGPRPMVPVDTSVRTRKVPKVILREKTETGEDAEEEVGLS